MRLTDEQFDDLGGALKAQQPPLPSLVNSFVDADGAYARLFKPVNTKPVLISKDTREFRLEEPLYVRRVEIFSQDYGKVNQGLSITVEMVNGEIKELRPAIKVKTAAEGSKTNFVQYVVKGFVTRVVVKSKLAYRKLTINKIDVVGYTLSQLELASKKIELTVDTIYAADAFVAEKKKAVDIEASKKTALEGEIAAFEAKKNAAEQGAQEAATSLENVQNQLGTAVGALEKTSANLRVAQDALIATQNNDAQLKEQIAGANREIVKKKEELQTLVNDRNLISDEYRDYVTEGKRQALAYISLLVIPLLVIGFCSWQLYQGALRILQLQATNPEQVLSMSLQRIPFAAAIAFVVAVCWKVMSLLIGRIMAIHGQRLALARLLVIAKDTVAASSAGLNISDAEKFRERMILKLQMLKGHLTSELGRDFEYVSPDAVENKVDTLNSGQEPS